MKRLVWRILIDSKEADEGSKPIVGCCGFSDATAPAQAYSPCSHAQVTINQSLEGELSNMNICDLAPHLPNGTSGLTPACLESYSNDSFYSPWSILLLWG